MKAEVARPFDDMSNDIIPQQKRKVNYETKKERGANFNHDFTQEIADHLERSLSAIANRLIEISASRGIAKDQKTRYNVYKKRKDMEINGEDLLRGGFSRNFNQRTSGEQTSVSRGDYREAHTDGNVARLFEGESSRGGEYANLDQRGVHGITENQRERLKQSAVRDSAGNLIALYHFTQNIDFEKFAIGDVGFHFGTENQAFHRADSKKVTKNWSGGRFIEAYLVIKKP